jgi:diguanylate cyclase (GGDEF)-like protein
LPDTAVNERAEFEREGIQSIAIVPMWDGARLAGFVGFDAVRQRVEWGEDYVMGLRLLAQMLGSALRSRTMARQLRAMAFHDPLTGLPNRKRLQEQLETALGEDPDQRPLMLAMVDLDDFKRINDAHGHAVGDAVLREVAIRLQGALRDQDTVARLGGDEFVVVVDDGGRLKPEDVAQRLRQAFRQPIEVEGHQFRLGLSIGMAVADGRGDADRLLRRADAAMYRAKDAGKDRWECDAATA